MKVIPPKDVIDELDCASHDVILNQARIMGVLNITPDSFSDGGLWLDRDKAIRQALRMQQQGADIIDVGGESTRPGAKAVPLQQELDRVIPVIEAITSKLEVLVSIDSSKPEVMHAAVSAGAGMINDVFALQHEGALEAAAKLAVPVCLMHMQGQPRLMQNNPLYDDEATEVAQFMLQRSGECLAKGILAKNIVLDPGFGFGKTLQHNLQLFSALPSLVALGYPVLVGVSRKAMIGQITKKPTADRMPGSITAAALAVLQGASIVRVHDVAETHDAVKIATALFSLKA
jgi:dihydropteroate synthase